MVLKNENRCWLGIPVISAFWRMREKDKKVKVNQAIYQDPNLKEKNRLLKLYEHDSDEMIYF